MQHKKLKVGIIFVLSLYLFIGSLYLNKVYGYTDVLDRPIEELNGLTLNEVFEEDVLLNNTFVDGSNWLNPDSNNINNVFDNKLTSTRLTATGTVGVVQSNAVIVTHSYYVVADIQPTTTNNIQFVSLQLTSITNTNRQLVTMKTVAENTTFRIYQLNNNITDIFIVYSVYAFDLTHLGIDTLTKEQMDYFYKQYNFYKDTQSVTYDGLGNKIINIIRDFGNTISQLFDYLMNTSYNVFGYEISFLALITGGILMVLLGLQVVWLFI